MGWFLKKEDGVLLIVLVPLMFFVIGPYMRKVTDGKKRGV